MTSFYCKECKEIHAEYCPKKSWFRYNIGRTEYTINITDKEFDDMKKAIEEDKKTIATSGYCQSLPKRKSFEFEGNTYFARFLFVGKVFEHYPTGGGGFYFYYLPFDRSKGEYMSNCHPTKEAAEAARQELIKLNEELL